MQILVLLFLSGTLLVGGTEYDEEFANSMLDACSKVETEFSQLKTQDSQLKTQYSQLKTEHAQLKVQFAGQGSKLKAAFSQLKAEKLETEHSTLKTQDDELSDIELSDVQHPDPHAMLHPQPFGLRGSKTSLSTTAKLAVHSELSGVHSPCLALNCQVSPTHPPTPVAWS